MFKETATKCNSQGAAGRESGLEGLAIAGVAGLRARDTTITGSEQDGGTPRAELAVSVAKVAAMRVEHKHIYRVNEQAASTHTARSCSCVKPSSLKPNEVVRTKGGLSSASRELMISRKPERSPSWVLSPTEMNVVGTLVATPTVYWISKV